MKRVARIAVLFFLAAPLASAQDWAKAALQKSPRHREWVMVKHDNRVVETFVVYPESKSKTPVVLIIHEIFGMTDWVEDLADQVAAAGYIAAAPDLLSGMGPSGGRSSDFAGCVKSASGSEAVHTTAFFGRDRSFALVLEVLSRAVLLVLKSAPVVA